MKKTSLSALCIAMCMLFSGCIGTPEGNNGGTAQPIMDVLTDDMRAVYQNRSASLPAAVIYTFQGEGEHVESPLYGEDAVNAVLDAIAEISITGETDMTVADNDSSYTFVNADGTVAGKVSFNGKFLECGDKKYEIEGKGALIDIDFIAESDSDTLAIDGPDPRLAEFFERCKTEAPVSVKVVQNGSEHEITDAATIESAIDALYSINLTMYAFQGTQAPSSELIATFAMQDGAQYSLTFHDDVIYVYEYPEPLGIWSFCTDGAERFIDVLKAAK